MTKVGRILFNKISLILLRNITINDNLFIIFIDKFNYSRFIT